MELSSKTLETGARLLEVQLNKRQLDQFRLYYKELVKANKSINLTTVVEWEAVQIRHFLDSISVYRALPADLLSNARVVDVGTGAGFPGLPLRIAFPKMELHLVESTSKKATFLGNLIKKLELGNVQVHTKRAELLAHLPAFRDSFSCVVSRAVAKLNVLAELTLPFCRIGGVVIAQKQSEVQPEIEEAKRALHLLGGKLKEVVGVSLGGLTKSRSLVVLEKVSLTPSQYPRRPGMPAKRPL